MATGPTQRDRHGLPQFTLRKLFLATAAFAVLCAVFTAVGQTKGMALLLVLALAGLHVAGNVIGTSMRNETITDARERIEQEAGYGTRSGPTTDGYGTRSVPATEVGEPSRLHQRTPLGWIIGATSLAGGLCGGTLGSVVLAPYSASAPGLILGSISFGVLGALFGLLGGCFFDVSLRAWWQASRASSTQVARRRLDERVASERG